MKLTDWKFGRNPFQSNRLVMITSSNIMLIFSSGCWSSNLCSTVFFIWLFRDSTTRPKITPDKWVEYARTAFSVDPQVALSLASRFPANVTLKAEITQLVQVCLHFSSSPLVVK